MPGCRRYVFCFVVVLFIAVQLRGSQNFQIVFQGDVPESFFVESLTFEVDTVLAHDELVGLLGFDRGGHVTRRYLELGLKFLQQKNKFQHVLLTVTPSAKGCAVHCQLQSFWSFEKIHCRGTLIGKDRYKHYYLMRSGDRFDSAKHEDSLKRVRESFYDQGNFQPIIKDTLSKDLLAKTITVFLFLRPGKTFTINKVKTCFIDSSPDGEARLITSRLKKVVFHELHGAVCSKEMLEYAARQVQEQCLQRGFLQAAVEWEKTIDYGRGRVDLMCKIALGDQRIFEFFGNHYFSDKELLSHLMLFGKSLLFLPPSLLVEELKTLYLSKGFHKVEISWREELGRCFFCITEGSRMRIGQVKVVGAQAVTEKFIMRCFAPCTRSKVFEKSVQRSCRDRLMRTYRSLGFWDCAILHEELRCVQGDLFEFVMHVAEGEQRTVSSVLVEGFEELQSAGPFAPYYNLTEPIPFDIQSIQEQRRYLLRYFQDKGYLHVSPQPTFETTKKGSVLIWKITGIDDRVHFGKTILRGSGRLPALFIVRELLFNEGDVWEQERVDRSLARLRALGLFEHVSLHSLDFEDLGGQKNLLLEYIEDDPFELRLRGGAQCIGRNITFRDMGFRVGGSFLWKNPRNQGDIFLFDANVTRYTRNIVGAYTLPWLFDLPIKNTFKGYSIRFDQPVASCSIERLYRLAQDGCAFVLGYEEEGVQVGSGFGVEWMAVSKLSKRHAQAIHFQPRLVGEHVPYFFVEPTLMASRLDDSLEPSKGFISLIAAKCMVPGDIADAYFLRVLAEQSIFVPILGSLVLAFRLRGGHVFNQCFQEVMPSERFYLGGGYSLRGYDPDLAPPLATTSFMENLCLVPIGGRSMINATCELRFPLYNNFGGVVFTDCGVLAQDDLGAIHRGNILGASGFGIRYTTPVGPLRFDIGWKWKKEPEEKRSYAWFLTLGQAF